jgi:hypothetical protein
MAIYHNGMKKKTLHERFLIFGEKLSAWDAEDNHVDEFPKHDPTVSVPKEKWVSVSAECISSNVVLLCYDYHSKCKDAHTIDICCGPICERSAQLTAEVLSLQLEELGHKNKITIMRDESTGSVVLFIDFTNKS